MPIGFRRPSRFSSRKLAARSPDGRNDRHYPCRSFSADLAISREADIGNCPLLYFSNVGKRLALFDACPTGSIESFYARAVGQASNKAKRKARLILHAVAVANVCYHVLNKRKATLVLGRFGPGRFNLRRQ